MGIMLFFFDKIISMLTLVYPVDNGPQCNDITSWAGLPDSHLHICPLLGRYNLTSVCSVMFSTG